MGFFKTAEQRLLEKNAKLVKEFPFLRLASIVGGAGNPDTLLSVEAAVLRLSRIFVRPIDVDFLRFPLERGEAMHTVHQYKHARLLEGRVGEKPIESLITPFFMGVFDNAMLLVLTRNATWDRVGVTIGKPPKQGRKRQLFDLLQEAALVEHLQF